MRWRGPTDFSVRAISVNLYLDMRCDARSGVVDGCQAAVASGGLEKLEWTHRCGIFPFPLPPCSSGPTEQLFCCRISCFSTSHGIPLDLLLLLQLVYTTRYVVARSYYSIEIESYHLLENDRACARLGGKVAHGRCP